MPTNESEDTTRRLRLAQQIDTGRAATDPFKLPAQLRADVDADTLSLSDTDLETGTAKGDRIQSSGAKRRALTELERQLKGGYRFIQGLDEETITDEQRGKIYETYGWTGGEVGRFDDERVISMATTASQVGATQIPQAEWRYPQARLDRIALQLGIVTGNAVTASGGTQQEMVDLRDAALTMAATTLSRVRFYYCSASRDADKTPELAKLDYQPRRPYGSVKKKAAPAAATPSAAVPPVPAPAK